MTEKERKLRKAREIADRIENGSKNKRKKQNNGWVYFLGLLTIVDILERKL